MNATKSVSVLFGIAGLALLATVVVAASQASTLKPSTSAKATVDKQAPAARPMAKYAGSAFAECWLRARPLDGHRPRHLRFRGAAS
jgi:septal ring-binding cell division protein DamX